MRFICGTQAVHKQLEQRLSEFLGTEDTILYSSCFDANGGLFETLLTAEDAVISDELNHASIIDGIRLCKAARYRYRNSDMADLEAKLQEARSARFRLIATDGVFSMDGYIANLAGDLRPGRQVRRPGDGRRFARRRVSWAAQGRGTHEYHGVMGRMDILTGTLGKALGGASGGYTSGRREIIELLRQRSRPYLFSNSLAPPIVGGLAQDPGPALRARPNCATAWKPTRGSSATAMAQSGFQILPGEHPIVPIMLGDAAAGRSDGRARCWPRACT